MVYASFWGGFATLPPKLHYNQNATDKGVMHYKKGNVNITDTKKGLNSLVELTTNPEQVTKKENTRTLIFFIIFLVLFVYAVFFASKNDSWSVYAIFFFSGIWLSQTYSNFQSVIGIKFLSKYIDIKKVKNDLKNT